MNQVLVNLSHSLAGSSLRRFSVLGMGVSKLGMKRFLGMRVYKNMGGGLDIMNVLIFSFLII